MTATHAHPTGTMTFLSTDTRSTVRATWNTRPGRGQRALGERERDGNVGLGADLTHARTGSGTSGTCQRIGRGRTWRFSYQSMEPSKAPGRGTGSWYLASGHRGTPSLPRR